MIDRQQFLAKKETSDSRLHLPDPHCPLALVQEVQVDLVTKTIKHDNGTRDRTQHGLGPTTDEVALLTVGCPPWGRRSLQSKSHSNGDDMLCRNLPLPSKSAWDVYLLQYSCSRSGSGVSSIAVSSPVSLFTSWIYRSTGFWLYLPLNCCTSRDFTTFTLLVGFALDVPTICWTAIICLLLLEAYVCED